MVDTAAQATALVRAMRYPQNDGKGGIRGMGGAQIFLKREDLNHTGAHKINNTIGQAMLAKRMGKPRVIAETGRQGDLGHRQARLVDQLFGQENPAGPNGGMTVASTDASCAL